MATCIFTEGAEAEHLYVVEDGRIAMASRSDDGRESVFALMERGDLFGEMPLLDGLGRSAEARALEPSEVMEIPYGPVREVFEKQPELLWGVVALLSGRLRNMDAALADSVFLDVTGRTAKRLLELGGDAGRVRPAGHPGGAGRHGRRLPRAGEQGHRQLRAPRLDRPVRAPLRHPRPRADHPPRGSRRRSRALEGCGMADDLFEEPRLASIYDALDSDRRDLEAYLAIAVELGARSVLDIGCGTGVLASLLSDAGFEVTGVDPAAAMLEVARAKPGAERVRWIHGAATDLPPLQVDLATMTGNVAQVFLEDEAWDRTLAAARAVLGPGGALVFETRRPERRAWEEWNRSSPSSASRSRTWDWWRPGTR